MYGIGVLSPVFHASLARHARRATTAAEADLRLEEITHAVTATRHDGVWRQLLLRRSPLSASSSSPRSSATSSSAVRSSSPAPGHGVASPFPLMASARGERLVGDGVLRWARGDDGDAQLAGRHGTGSPWPAGSSSTLLGISPHSLGV
uniref:Uncharacterized protein n=1 Tax=Leersia perrieri TaxID=77586 RepID=A0A0D9XUI9_9ORYZ